MKEELVLIGGGGHCKSCIDVIEEEGKYSIVGIIDRKVNVGKKVLGYSIFGSDEDIENIQKKYKNFFITVGQIDSSDIRRRMFKLINNDGINFPTIISPRSHVSKYSEVGMGSIIMHNSLINADAKIGSFNIINSNSVLEHDVIAGDFNHFSVSASVCGSVNIGNDCFIGSNSVLRNNIKVGDSVIIGASSYVNRDIVEPGIYIGTPVRSFYE